MNIVYKYDIQTEVLDLMFKLGEDEFINGIENGSYIELIEMITKLIEPLSQKLLGSDGSIIVRSMPRVMV
jgi:hypothetical protein